jgi:hypothetical protein
LAGNQQTRARTNQNEDSEIIGKDNGKNWNSIQARGLHMLSGTLR